MLSCVSVYLTNINCCCGGGASSRSGLHSPLPKTLHISPHTPVCSGLSGAFRTSRSDSEPGAPGWRSETGTTEELRFNVSLKPNSAKKSSSRFINPQLRDRTGPTPAEPTDRKALTHLQADRQVDPAAEGGADGSGVEPQVLEEFGEGLRQGCPGTLLSYHHTGPDPGQVQASRLKIRQSQRHSSSQVRSSSGVLPSERPSAGPGFWCTAP